MPDLFEEEKKSVEWRVFQRLNDAQKLLKESRSFVSDTKNVARAVVLEAVKYRNAKKARKKYESLRFMIKELLPEALKNTKEAVAHINFALINLLRPFETLTKGAFAFSKKVESALSLNVQRCEAMSEHIKGLLERLENIPNFDPQGIPQGIRLADSLSQDLEKVEDWYEAALKTRNIVIGQVNLPTHRKRWGIAPKLSLRFTNNGAWASLPETFGWFTAACRSTSMG